MIEELGHLSGHVAVVGSGMAGLMAALTLAPQPVVLLTRAGLGQGSSSGWAQGGMAASLADDDSADLHLRDTLAAGDGLCDPAIVASMLQNAGPAVAALERYGVRFDQVEGHRYALGLEAAHCRRRILHVAGDGSGAAIVKALVEAVLKTSSVTILPHTDVRRILNEDGAIAGLLCATSRGPVVLRTSRVVLATGGIGGLYEATTNPLGNFGQGIALAARAGAMLADMEFVQFHPTALDTSRRPLGLISEAVRGEGAILVNERGNRFLAEEPGAELAPRDVVARAIAMEIARGGRVFLDARRALGGRFADRFPTIAALCREAGIDPSDEPIPVRPAAHYHMGGVATNASGRSSVEGLWVVGEAACTGLHGANRLASNSLLEAAVMGMQVSHDIASVPAAGVTAIAPAVLPLPADPSAIRPIASRHLGLLRNAGSINSAITSLLPLVESEGAAADPAVVALLIAVFASLRHESRGAHARTDFPLKLANATRRRMSLAEALQVAHSTVSQPFARTA